MTFIIYHTQVGVSLCMPNTINFVSLLKLNYIDIFTSYAIYDAIILPKNTTNIYIYILILPYKKFS